MQQALLVGAKLAPEPDMMQLETLNMKEHIQ